MIIQRRKREVGNSFPFYFVLLSALMRGRAGLGICERKGTCTFPFHALGMAAMSLVLGTMQGMLSNGNVLTRDESLSNTGSKKSRPCLSACGRVFFCCGRIVASNCVPGMMAGLENQLVSFFKCSLTSQSFCEKQKKEKSSDAEVKSSFITPVLSSKRTFTRLQPHNAWFFLLN